MIILQVKTEDFVKKAVDLYGNRTQKEMNTLYPFMFKNTLKPGKATLLEDVYGVSALLVNKTNIADIFKGNIDISAFKTPLGQLNTSYNDLVKDLKDKGVFDQVTLELRDVYTPLGKYDQDIAQRFYTFLKVYGVSVIDINDVDLYLADDILSIHMLDSHPYLTGNLEIKTWL